MARYDDLNTGSIAYAALVSTILLMVLILLFRAMCYGWIEGEDVKKLANAHYVQSDTIIGQQKARIDGYAKEMVEVAPPAEDPTTATTAETADPAEKPAVEPTLVERLHIPMERAKELLLKEMATTPSGPAT